MNDVLIEKERSNEAKHGFVMTLESIEAFLESERISDVAAGTVSRLRTAVRMLYDFLPEDKLLTRQQLVAWREDMSEKGYADQTVQNYAKWLNLYLDYVGLSAIRFNRGRRKDIFGMEFGYLTAVEPTEKRSRRDVVWLCRCRCGTVVELPATCLLLNNTLSCGCVRTEVIKRANKYFDGTSIEQSLRDPVTSTRSRSGYVGVTRKKDKWQAYITYKGQHISLGTYNKLEDAVKARARGKETVMGDAAELLQVYEAIHKNDETLPGKEKAPQKVLLEAPNTVRCQVATVKRYDNTSGHTGVSRWKDKWEARISYNKVRYTLGRFERLEEAVAARNSAEELLRRDPTAFAECYSTKKGKRGNTS